MAGKKLTAAQKVERERQVWHYITTQGWTQTRVAEHTGLTQPQVSIVMKRLSQRANAQLSEEIASHRMMQINLLQTMLMDCMEAWAKSKEGRKSVSRTSAKRKTGVAADGSPIFDEVTTTNQTMLDSPGEVRYLAEAREIMGDLRKLLDLNPEIRVNLSWQSMLPVGYEADDVARQFAAMMQAGAITDVSKSGA